MSNISIYYLEMTNPQALNASPEQSSMQIIEAEIKQFAVNRFLYQLVGEAWQWFDKNQWTAQQWGDYAEDSNLRTWVAYIKGSIAGYFELKTLANNTVEIAYFGLTPAFIGQGFGGHLLTQAIKAAWAITDTEKVIVNTCTLDHPNALKNYQARGMRIYKTDTVSQ